MRSLFHCAPLQKALRSRPRFVDLVAPLATAGRAQEVADAPTIQGTGADDAIVDHHPAVSPSHRDAGQDASPYKAGETFSVRPSGRALKLGRVEIGEPDLDPGRRIRARSDAQTVAVADVADKAREGIAGAVGQPSFAGIRPGDRRKNDEESCGQDPFHDVSLTRGPSPDKALGEERKGGLWSLLEGAAKETAMTAPLDRIRISGRPDEPSPAIDWQSVEDHQLLELMVSRPDGNSRAPGSGELATALLDRFGSVGAVSAADPVELLRVGDMSEGIVQDLKMLRELAVRLARIDAGHRPVISSWNALLDYARAALAHLPREQFRALFLDRRNILLRDELVADGSVDHAPVYPREVIRRALELSASSLILVHNHPSGDPTPSQADITMTRQIIDAAKLFGIQVHDHIVVGRDGTASFRAIGLI